MYKNIGKTIMILSQVIGWGGLILGILIGVQYLEYGDGWILIIWGIILFIGSLPLYGFGQLVEDIHSNKNHSESKTEEITIDELAGEDKPTDEPKQ